MSKFVTFCSSLLIAFIFASCKFHDPELEKADGGGSGYSLTPLGCLVYAPWKARLDVPGSFLQVLEGDSIYSSRAQPYTDQEKNLIFRLLKNGTATFTLSSKQGDPKSKTDEGTGIWRAKYEDSTISIKLKSVSSRISIEGKYIYLGASMMQIQETSLSDTILDGHTKQLLIKKVISYEHPH